MTELYPEIRARLADITGEPWAVAESGHYGRLVWGVGVDYDPSDPSGQTAMQTQEIVAQQIPRGADAEFIAHAPDDIRLLLNEARIAGDVLDMLEGWIDRNGEHGISTVALKELNALLAEIRA